MAERSREPWRDQGRPTVMKMCKFYNTSLGCRLHANGHCPYVHVCAYYIRSACRYGDHCVRSHDLDEDIMAAVSRPKQQPRPNPSPKTKPRVGVNDKLLRGLKNTDRRGSVEEGEIISANDESSVRQGPIDDMKRTARKSCWSGRPEMRDLIDRHEATELEPPHRGGARHHSGPGPHGSPGPRGGPGPHNRGRGRGQNTRYSGDNRQPHPFRDRSYYGRERGDDNRTNDRIRDSEFANDRDKISETNRNIYRHDDRRSGTYKSDFHSNKEPFRKSEQSKNHRSRSRDRDSRRSGSRDSRRRSRSRDFKRRSRSRDLSRRSKSRDSKRSSSRDSRSSKSRDNESSCKNQIKSMVVNKLKKDDQSSDLSSQESSPMRSWKNERFKDSRNKKPIASELKNESSIICVSSKDDFKKSKAVNDKRLDDDILMNNEIRSDGTSPFNNDAPEIIVTVQCDSLEKPKKKTLERSDSLEKPKKKTFERRLSKEEEIKDKAEKTNDSSSKQDEMKKCDQTFPKSNFVVAESKITDTRTEISKSNDKGLKDRVNQSSEQDAIESKSKDTSSKSSKVTNTQEVKRKSISESTQSEKNKMSDPGITMNVKSVDKSKVVPETSGSSSNNCLKSENSDLNISTNLNPKSSFKEKRRSSSDYNKAKLGENSTVNSSKTSDQKQTTWSLSSKNHQNKENSENTNKPEERLVVKHKEPNIISETVKTSLKHEKGLKTDNGSESAKTLEAKMTGMVEIDISENVAPVIAKNKPDNKRSLDSQSLEKLKKEISGLGVKPRRKSVEFDKHMGINNKNGNCDRKLESSCNKSTFNNTVDANENNKKVTELLPNNSEVDKETDRSEIRIRRKSGKEPLQPADNRTVSIDENNQPKPDKLSHQMPPENVTFDLVGQILRAGEKREKRRNSGNHSSSVKPTVESNDMKSTSSKSSIITSTPLKEAKQTDSKVKGTENVIDENATNGETELPSFVQVCLDRSQSVCDRVNTFEKLDKENPELLFKKNVPRKSLFLETNKKSMKNLHSRGQMDLNARPVTKPSLFASKFTHKKDTVVSNPSVQDVPLPENEKQRSSEKMLKIRSGASNQIKLMKTSQPSSWKDKNKKQDFSPKKKNLFSKKKRDRSPLLHRKLNKSQDGLKNKSPNASDGQARTNIFESFSKNFVPSAHEKKKDGLSVKNVDKHHVKRTTKESSKMGSVNERLKPSQIVQTQQDKDKPNGHQPKSRSKIETSQSDQSKSLSDIEKSLKDQAKSLSDIEKSLRDQPKSRSNIEKSQSDQSKSPTLETSSLESSRLSKDKTKHILKASHTNLPSCIVPLGKDALKRRASCERKMETTSVSVGIENKPQSTEDCLNASSNLTLNSKKMERAAMTAGEIAECDEKSNEKTNSDIISQELSQQSDSSIDTLTCQAVIEECLNEMTRPSSASTADLCSNREQTGKSEDNIMNVDKSENNDGENLQTPKHKQDGMNIVDQTHTKDKTCDNDNSKVPSVITDDDIEDDDFCLIDINPYTTHAKAVIADSKVSECSSNDATKDNTNDLYDDKAVPVIESMTENSSNFAEEMYEPHTSDISDDEDAAEYETRKRTCNMTIKYCDDRVFIESNEQAINQRINEKNTPVDHIQDKGESSTCNVNNVRNKVVSVPDDSNKRNKVASVPNDNSERNKVTSACNDSNEVNKVASVSNDNSERNNVASACNDSSERNKVASVSNDNSGRNKVASVSNDNSGRSKVASVPNDNSERNKVASVPNHNSERNKVASVPNDKNERNKVASVPNDKSEQNKVASACNDRSERNKVAFVPNENSGRNKVDPVPNDDSEQNKVAYACNDNSEGNKLASVRNSPSINTREKSDNQKLCKRKNSVTSSAESPEDSVQPKKIKVDNEAYTPDKTHDGKNEQSFKKQLKFKSDSPMKLTPRKRNYADILASASKGFDEPASPDNKSSDKEDKQSVKNGKLKRKLSKDEIENDSDLGTTESPSKKKRTDHKDVESPKDRKKEMKKALEKAKMTIKVPVNNGKKSLSTSDSSCLPISESYSKALPMEQDALPIEKEAVLREKEAVPMEKEVCEESTAVLEQTNEVVASEHQDPNSPDSVSSDDKALETPPIQLSECSVESSIPVLKNGFNVSHTLTLKDLRRVTTIGHLDPQRVYSGQRCILCQVCMNYFTPLQFTFHHDSSSIVCNIDGEKSMRNSYHPEHPNIIHWNEEAGKIWDEFEKIFEREKSKALSSTLSKSKSFHEDKTVGQTVCDSQKSPRGVLNKTVEPTSSSNVAISPDKQKVMTGASNMTINKTNHSAQQSLIEPSKLKVSDIQQSKETSNVRTSKIHPNVQQKFTETSNVTTSPDQQTVEETPVALATNSKQTVQQNLTETTNQKASPVKTNMETSIQHKLTETSSMVTSPDQQKCTETSNLLTSLYEQNDKETNTLATKTKQTIQQEHTEISNPQVSAVQKSVETSNVKIGQIQTNLQQTANVMTSRDQQKDSETSNKLVTNKQNIQQNPIETLNLKVSPVKESSTETNSTVSKVSRASTEILNVCSPTMSVATERENSTMVQDNSFKHQPIPIFESSLLSEDELLAALWKKFNLNIADNDYCNLMLGYKLQLRSGLRINQRRTLAFAAAAAQTGQFRTEDEMSRHNATNSMLWKQRKVIEAKVRKSSSLERHLEQLSTRNLEQSSTRNLEQSTRNLELSSTRNLEQSTRYLELSSTRNLEQLSSRNLEQSTKNPEQLSTRTNSNKGAREEILKHTNGTSI